METAIEFIAHNYSGLNYLTFFNTYCSTKNTTESIDYFKTIVASVKEQELARGENGSVKLVNWCNSVQEGDYQVLRSDLLNSLWSLKNAGSTQKNFMESYQGDILNEISNSINRNSGSSSSRTIQPKQQVKRKYTSPTGLLVPRVECDPILFGPLSVATIIKKDAVENFLAYCNLSEEEQYRISLGLNSTIDLTNIGSQHVLFTTGQWAAVQNRYKKPPRCRSTLSDPAKDGITEVNDKLNAHEVEFAYDTARTVEISQKDNTAKRLISIYAHIVRVYNERSYILSTTLIGVYSENDAIVKIWGEIFEILFGGNKDIYLRWGETTSNITTAQKKLSRPGDKNVVGLKIDCRAIAYFEKDNKEVDLMNLEAAKEYEDNKVMGDRSKLVAEAKCALDYFLKSDAIDSEKKKKLCVPIIQIAGAKCEVCYYTKVADGLYTLDSIGFLTLSPLYTEFSEHSHAWFKFLIHFRTMVLDLYDTSLLIEQKNAKSFSTSNIDSQETHSTEIRGTFFPPTKASPIPRLPNNLYASTCPPLYEIINDENIQKKLKTSRNS